MPSALTKRGMSLRFFEMSSFDRSTGFARSIPMAFRSASIALGAIGTSAVGAAGAVASVPVGAALADVAGTGAAALADGAGDIGADGEGAPPAHAPTRTARNNARDPWDR